MKSSLLCSLSALALLSCAKHETPVKPNVILILSDDQGWGDLSITGNQTVSTPHVDNLAKNGVTFNHFYVCPVCSPTRAEILTGRYYPRGGVYSTSSGGERLDPDETTIAQVFKKAGYATAAYGKWHNGMQPPYHPNARGFDDFYGFCSGHWGNYFSPMLEHNGQIVMGHGFLEDDLTNHALAFMEKNKDRPFFLYLPFNTPHSPMQVPDSLWNTYKDKELQQRNRDPERENVTFTRAALALSENIDWNVGRLMQKMEDLGLTQKTIVVYLSDNGPNSWRWNGGMKGRKGSTDEGGVRSPMFIQWKGTLKAGKKIEEIAADIDLLPTLASLAGINDETSHRLDGISLRPLLLEDNPDLPDRLIFNYWGKSLSIRSQQYRLDDEDRLFDMEKDPGQETDVSKEYPEITRKLIHAKEKWKRDVLSELPEHDTRPFTIGDPGYRFTQLPARDAIANGNIHRSNRWPNCSFFTGFTSLNDSITWDAEVLADGDFRVQVYYTCPAKDVGSTIQVRFNSSKLKCKITEANDPPLQGMQYDRVPREESYVKDFKPVDMGVIHLKKGKGILTLKALEIPGSTAMDFRLLMLERINE